MNKNFIIEVKTKWELKGNIYERNIIEFTYNKDRSYLDKSIYSKYLNESRKYTETSSNIDKNEYEFNILDNTTREVIEEPSRLIKLLLEFTKYQYLKED